MSRRSFSALRQMLGVALALGLLAPNALAERTQLKPGMNFFSPKQDIELGQRAAQEAEQQLPMLNNPQVDAYLNRLGKRLARHAPGHDYPYQFKAVNQEEINAFALPGGFLYVNRGTIEAASNESELAGVMAHEIAHVALRHGTNQLSKATLAQAPLAILGGLLGGGGAVEQLAQLGIQVGFTSVFLKFSRDAETQADLLGTQILHDARYDPQGVADFFDTLQKKGGGGTIEFFSSHPNPENRQENIQEEIQKLGPLENPKRDSEEFHVIKQLVKQMPPAPKRGERQPDTGSGEGREVSRPAERPSNRFRSYSHRYFTLRYPDNWEVHEGGSQVLFAPRGGAAQNAIAYGVLTNVRTVESRRWSLEQATDQLLQELLQADPGLREVDRREARVGGRRALATQLRGQSPIQGQQETDWLFTVRLRNRLFYALFIVPESDYQNYQSAFQQILNSIRFR